jgi:hypothetical protein
MTLPSAQSVGKAVVMTLIAVIIIKAAKPYLPASVQSLIPL